MDLPSFCESEMRRDEQRRERRKKTIEENKEVEIERVIMINGNFAPSKMLQILSRTRFFWENIFYDFDLGNADFYLHLLDRNSKLEGQKLKKEKKTLKSNIFVE